MTTVHLLQAFPDVAEHYRRRFRHVLVDEYQDTNHAQYMLVRELVGTRQRRTVDGDLVGPASSTPELRRPSSCVVGDADQSIYAFRGATIRNILQFERTTPTRAIDPARAELPVDADDPVRGQRRHRPQPRPQAEAACGPTAGDGDADRRLRRRQRARRGAVRRRGDRPARRRQALAKPGDVAVFYRTNAQSRVFEEVFIRVGLPYKVVGGVRFYERREVRDALAYLRTAGQPRRLGVAAPHPQRAAARASATVPRPASRRSPSGSGSPSGRRCAGQRMRRGSQRGR